jgi:deoxycytidylate deaminase
MSDAFGRPAWDDVYMAMSFLASRRSLDPRTQHGCIIVSKDNRPLSWGNNGPLGGIDDSRVPLSAPEKYYHLLHSEENAILSYCGSNADIEGGTCYVTGECCYRCLRGAVRKGIRRIVQGHVKSFMIHTVPDEEFVREQRAKQLLVELSKVRVENVGPRPEIRAVLMDAIAYFDRKKEDFDADAIHRFADSVGCD